nr:MAG TPA: hypothetical protein [Caudoviricetes sp.]
MILNEECNDDLIGHQDNLLVQNHMYLLDTG